MGVTANFGLVLFRDYLLALILAQPAVLAKSVTKTSVTLGFFLPFAAHCTNGALFPADYCQAEQTPELHATAVIEDAVCGVSGFNHVADRGWRLSTPNTIAKQRDRFCRLTVPTLKVRLTSQLDQFVDDVGVGNVNRAGDRAALEPVAGAAVHDHRLGVLEQGNHLQLADRGDPISRAMRLDAKIRTWPRDQRPFTTDLILVVLDSANLHWTVNPGAILAHGNGQLF